ncbi:MAG: HD domain-containing protein [bacterium]
MDDIINAMKEVFNGDSRLIGHTMEVLRYANEIISGENIDQKTALIIREASILHDIGVKEAERKYGSSDGPYQEKEGGIIARKVLEQFGRDPEHIERVCYIVGNHHTKDKIDGLDFQIVWEADLLVNLKDKHFSIEDIEGFIDENFKTKKGLEIARKLFIAKGD